MRQVTIQHGSGYIEDMRPGVITPEIAAKIAEMRRQPYASARAIHRALTADGHKLSWRTLQRHIGATEGPGGASGGTDPDDDVPRDADRELGAGEVAADLRRRYGKMLGIAEALEARAKLGGPECRRYYEAVRLLGELGAKIAEIAPKPVLPADQDPANVEGKRLVLERAREIADRQGNR